MASATRGVDDLVKVLGAAPGISQSQVSRICAGTIKELAESRERPISCVAVLYVLADVTP